MPVVYLVTNKINGKKYIGVDGKNNPSYLGSGKIIRQAITKYGKKNFTKEIIKSFDQIEDAFYYEKILIEEVSAVTSEDYYNIKPGGYGGHNGYDFSGKNNPMYGKSVKDIFIEKHGEKIGLLLYDEAYKEGRKKQADKLRDRNLSDEHKKSISAGKKEYYRSLSKERREELSLIHSKTLKAANIKRSDEYKDKMKESMLLKTKTIHRIEKCKYCSKETNIANITRWHNENCKHKT